ncbi:MAG: LytTR family DNA-binding domain-containing protein [Bacteroidota bacterium]
MRVLIVEDERIIAQRLERLLRGLAGSELTRVDVSPTLTDARAVLDAMPPDVVFLDLNLHGEDGFDLLRDVVAGAFHTVVVSAHTERALEAFEVGVLDFVPKPFGQDRLALTLDRLRGARAAHPAATLAVRSSGRIELVPVADIAHVHAADSYAELVLRDGSVRLHAKSLERLLTILPTSFVQIHRSYLVRLGDIVQLRVRPGSRYSAVLRSGVELPVGRTRVDDLRKRLGLHTDSP